MKLHLFRFERMSEPYASPSFTKYVPEQAPIYKCVHCGLESGMRFGIKYKDDLTMGEFTNLNFGVKQRGEKLNIECTNDTAKKFSFFERIKFEVPSSYNCLVGPVWSYD